MNCLFLASYLNRKVSTGPHPWVYSLKTYRKTRGYNLALLNWIHRESRVSPKNNLRPWLVKVTFAQKYSHNNRHFYPPPVEVKAKRSWNPFCPLKKWLTAIRLKNKTSPMNKKKTARGTLRLNTSKARTNPTSLALRMVLRGHVNPFATCNLLTWIPMAYLVKWHKQQKHLIYHGAKDTKHRPLYFLLNTRKLLLKCPVNGVGNTYHR